jgi:carbon storage regulator
VLVLTRKLGEGIVLGDDVRLKVLRISGSRVTIGIDAPSHVRVLRSDLHDAMLAEEGGADVTVLPTLKDRAG